MNKNSSLSKENNFQDTRICKNRQRIIEKQFLELCSIDQRYDLLIQRGKTLIQQNKLLQNELYRVHGCQSVTYIEGTCTEQQMKFSGSSNTLISSGILSLFLEVYNELHPLSILQCAPQFAVHIGFQKFLSINRANSFQAIYQHICKQSFFYLKNFI